MTAAFGRGVGTGSDLLTPAGCDQRSLRLCLRCLGTWDVLCSLGYPAYASIPVAVVSVSPYPDFGHVAS